MPRAIAPQRRPPARDSIDTGFTTPDNVIQVTIRRVW